MTYRIVTSRINVKHRQNVELVNVARKNHPTDKIAVIIES